MNFDTGVNDGAGPLGKLDAPGWTPLAAADDAPLFSNISFEKA